MKYFLFCALACLGLFLLMPSAYWSLMAFLRMFLFIGLGFIAGYYIGQTRK